MTPLCIAALLYLFSSSVPAFITTSEYGKERKRRAASSLWPSDKEEAG